MRTLMGWGAPWRGRSLVRLAQRTSHSPSSSLCHSYPAAACCASMCVCEEREEEERSGKVSHAREPGDKVECLAQNVYMCVILETNLRVQEALRVQSFFDKMLLVLCSGIVYCYTSGFLYSFSPHCGIVHLVQLRTVVHCWPEVGSIASTPVPEGGAHGGEVPSPVLHRVCGGVEVEGRGGRTTTGQHMPACRTVRQL